MVTRTTERADVAPRRGRGRRPTAEVRADIVQAAGEVLLERGMGEFTIEGVAARAGASKMTVYKLWPSKGALALEGYFTSVGPVLAFPDTGDIRNDLTAQLHSFVELLTQTEAGRVQRDLIAHAQNDPHLMDLYLHTYSGPRRALAVTRLEAAQAVGQLRADLDVESVVDQLWGACYHRLLIPNLPLDLDFVDTLIDNLFRPIDH